MFARIYGYAKTTAVLPLVLVVALAGCTDDGGSGTGAEASDHNSADVEFATQMIPHHAQALSMVDLTVGRELPTEVAELAEQIRDAQAPEIEQMADWLEAWGEEIPDTLRDHGSDHDMGDMDDMGEMDDMPGMMSDEQMEELEAASDAEFTDLFLAMMIEHHEGAIGMARIEQESGQYAEAIALAEQIETSQAEEITLMESLLD